MSARPLPDLDAWIAHFLRMDLPVFASTAATIGTLRGCEDAVDAHLLAQEVGGDPLMVLKLLSHVAALRHPRRTSDAETVTEALVMLGIPPFFRAFGEPLTVEQLLHDAPEARTAVAALLRRSRRAATFALGFAVHRMDDDAAVIHQTALLHEFGEMLLWCHAPALALELRRRLDAEPALEPGEAQQRLLNMRLDALQLALMRAWRLPALMLHISDDHPGAPSPVRCVALAVRLARRTERGWPPEGQEGALHAELQEIAALLHLSPPAALRLVRELDD
ncbi:HDOD domain-containing protein [Caldimonas tepidiphila]|uniref:HDOD domain-containing protein n=1 Tax=Caldimonas tepidiphila TaxID=2315841 RepID=UPI000E5B56F1|nr:HDOD domain-containing protein [Caldimonas tepidiphila]